MTRPPDGKKSIQPSMDLSRVPSLCTSRAEGAPVGRATVRDALAALLRPATVKWSVGSRARRAPAGAATRFALLQPEAVEWSVIFPAKYSDGWVLGTSPRMTNGRVWHSWALEGAEGDELVAVAFDAAGEVEFHDGDLDGANREAGRLNEGVDIDGVGAEA